MAAHLPGNVIELIVLVNWGVHHVNYRKRFWALYSIKRLSRIQSNGVDYTSNVFGATVYVGVVYLTFLMRFVDTL